MTFGVWYSWNDGDFRKLQYKEFGNIVDVVKLNASFNNHVDSICAIENGNVVYKFDGKSLDDTMFTCKHVLLQGWYDADKMIASLFANDVKQKSNTGCVMLPVDCELRECHNTNPALDVHPTRLPVREINTFVKHKKKRNIIWYCSQYNRIFSEIISKREEEYGKFSIFKKVSLYIACFHTFFEEMPYVMHWV